MRERKSGIRERNMTRESGSDGIDEIVKEGEGR